MSAHQTAHVYGQRRGSSKASGDVNSPEQHGLDATQLEHSLLGYE